MDVAVEYLRGGRRRAEATVSLDATICLYSERTTLARQLRCSASRRAVCNRVTSPIKNYLKVLIEGG